MTEFINHQKISREELEKAYIEEMDFYKRNHIKREFDKYMECFWILFNDGSNDYLWSVETVCSCYPECDRNKLEIELDKYL